MATSDTRHTRGGRTGDEAPEPIRATKGLALGLIAIGVGLASVALLGPFAFAVVNYHVTETLQNQLIGLDALSLLLVAPLSFLAALLVLRHHVAGPGMALGIGAYTSYMVLQYIVGPEYESLPGNNELLFPLHLLLFMLGWVVALAAWHAFDVERLPRSPGRDRLVGRVLLPLLAFVAFVRYLPALADWMTSTPDDAGYLAGPTFAWMIATLDLGVFLPATVVACVGLARGWSWAPKAVYTVVGWFGLVGPAVAAMATAMYVNDDPNASAASAALLGALGVAFAALCLFLFVPSFRSREGSRTEDI